MKYLTFTKVMEQLFTNNFVWIVRVKYRHHLPYAFNVHLQGWKELRLTTEMEEISKEVHERLAKVVRT